MQDDDQSEPKRMPLWKGVAEHIERHNKPGDLIETSWLLKELRHESADNLRFGIDVSNIRRYLEATGVYLSGDGFNGEKYQILHPRENVRVIRNYNRRAVDFLYRCCTLGNATDRGMLTTEEAQKHESYLGRVAARYALITRRNPEKILAATAKPKPKELAPA